MASELKDFKDVLVFLKSAGLKWMTWQFLMKEFFCVNAKGVEILALKQIVNSTTICVWNVSLTIYSKTSLPYQKRWCSMRGTSQIELSRKPYKISLFTLYSGFYLPINVFSEYMFEMYG